MALGCVCAVVSLVGLVCLRDAFLYYNHDPSDQGMRLSDATRYHHSNTVHDLAIHLELGLFYTSIIKVDGVPSGLSMGVPSGLRCTASNAPPCIKGWPRTNVT